jgi:AmmeMemoRadiSam system protein B
MDGVRSPVVAGAFYPENGVELDAAVHRMLGAADPPPIDLTVRMLIVPHAGYRYSGPVAATAFALLTDSPAKHIVLLGPSHFRGFPGLALPGHAAFATPLGVIAVDPGLAHLAAPHARPVPAAHAAEHSLEVQLPFLQMVLKDFTCLPVLTGDEDPEPGIGLLEAVVDDADLIVISSDLSHNQDHATAQQLDAETAAAIVELEPERIGRRRACGRTAVQAALKIARSQGWRCRIVDLRTSGDTAGDPRRVVGYGAFALGS